MNRTTEMGLDHLTMVPSHQQKDIAQGVGRERTLLERNDPGEREVLGEHEGLGQLEARVSGHVFKAMFEPSQELLDVIGVQACGQAASHTAERHVCDAQEPQRFERPIRALVQVRAASQRTRRNRDEVGGEIRRGVRDRSLV